MDEGMGAIIVGLIATLLILVPIKEENKKTELEMIENYEIIETHINVSKTGKNQYYIIVENPSGDLIEINTDINTFVKYGGDLEKWL